MRGNEQREWVGRWGSAHSVSYIKVIWSSSACIWHCHLSSHPPHLTSATILQCSPPYCASPVSVASFCHCYLFISVFSHLILCFLSLHFVLPARAGMSASCVSCDVFSSLLFSSLPFSPARTRGGRRLPWREQTLKHTHTQTTHTHSRVFSDLCFNWSRLTVDFMHLPRCMRCLNLTHTPNTSMSKSMHTC